MGALVIAQLMRCAPLTTPAPNPPGSDRGVARVSSAQTILPTGRRHALLIANHDYDDNDADLVNPAKDVELVAKALKAVSFETPVIHRNLTRDEMAAAIRRFAGTLKTGDEVFFTTRAMASRCAVAAINRCATTCWARRFAPRTRLRP